MQIATKRLLLRRPRLSDLDAIYAIMSNPTAMRYWSTLPHASLAVTRAWLEAMIASNAAGSDEFVIELSGEVIGKVGAWRLPEIGFSLHPEFWGRGYATEAVAAYVAHAFATTTTAELTADVDPRNNASLAVLSRLGFVEIGRAANTFLLGDEWCDSVYLGLKRLPVG